MRGGAVLQRSHGHDFDSDIINRARSPGTRLVVKPGHALLYKNGGATCLPSRRSRRSLAATFLFCPPSAQVNTIRAFRASACAVFRRFVSDVSAARSSSLNIRGASSWTDIKSFVAIPAPSSGTTKRIQCDFTIANL